MFLNQLWRSGHISSQGWWSRRNRNAAGGVFHTARPYIPSVLPIVAVRQFSAGNRGKDIMQNLNERLASYLEKVSDLESSNQKLEQQIQNYLNQNVPEERRDFTEKFQIVNELRQQIGDYFIAITKLNLQIEHAQFESQDYQIKTEEEAKMCLASEMEIHTLQELQRRGEAQKAELEFELSQWKEEMALLNTEREERLLEIRSKTSGCVNVELATKESADLIQVLHQLREECMTVIQKNQREVEQWFDKKMKELQAQEIHSSTETESNTTGLRELKQTFQNLSIELQELHLQMSTLEQNKMEMTFRYSQCLFQYQMRVNSLEDELRRLCSDINQQGASYQQLLDIKTHLELEIAQYKKTLDGGGSSECMSGSNITAVMSSHGSSIDTGFKTSTATYSALTNGSHHNKHTSNSSKQGVYSSIDAHTGKTREIIQSRFLSEGSAGTLVVQEQIIVSKQNRPVTSEKEQVGLSKSASSVQRSTISDLYNTAKTTTPQTSHLDSMHTISQKAPQTYSVSTVSETTELIGGSQASAQSQVSTSLPDAAKSIHTTKTVEIKSTANASNASHKERSAGVTSASEVLQTDLTIAATQVVKTGKSSPAKLSKASIYEKVMLWNAPLSNVNIEESEVSVPENSVEIKTDTHAVSSSAMENLLNTSITTAAVEANISHGQVEISAPGSTVDVKTTITTVGPSAMENLLNAGIATSAVLSSNVQDQVEISAPESAVEVKTTETVVDTSVKESLSSGIATSAVETSISQDAVEVKTTKTTVGTSAMESLLNAGIATTAVLSNNVQGQVELSAPGSTVEGRTTQVMGTSAIESLLNAGITTTAVLSNNVQGEAEISAPESTVEVKTSRTTVGTSAMESLLNAGIATSAVLSNKVQDQVEISAPESTVEVKTTETVVDTSVKDSLLSSGIVTSAVETSISQDAAEVTTTKTTVGTSAMESLLNAGIATTAVLSNNVQGQVQLSAPGSTVEGRTTQVMGTSAIENLLNAGITTSAVLPNNVQGQVAISAPESAVEVKTTKTTVGTSAMESLLNAGIASVAAESNTIQGEAEISAPESTVEVNTSRTPVRTSAMESLMNAGIATSAVLSNNVQDQVEIPAPEGTIEVKTTETVVAKESLLNSGIATSAVETSISQGQVEISAPESTVEVKTARTSVGTSTMESLLNAGIATTAVLSNNVQDQVEIPAPESTFEVKTTETVVDTSAKESLLISGIATSAVETSISQGQVEISAHESTVEVKTARTAVGTSVAGTASVAVESNTIQGVSSYNLQGQVEVSAPESTVKVKTSRTTVGTSAMESLLNAGIATTAVLSNNVQGQVELSAPGSMVEANSRIAVGSSAMERLLKTSNTTGTVETEVVQTPVTSSETKSASQTSITSSLLTTSQAALEKNIVQGIADTQSLQDANTESSASQSVVMTSVSEDAVDMKNRISESVVEPARLQSTTELRTVEVEKSEQVVETQGAKSLSAVQTVAPESKTEIKATVITGHTGGTDTLLGTSFGNMAVETHILASIAEVSVPDSSTHSTSVETKSSGSSVANLQDVSNISIPLSNGTKNRFELMYVGAGSTTKKDRNPYLHQSALVGHVSLPVVGGGIEGLTLDGVPRYTGTSSQVIIGGSSREARISQPRKLTNSEGVQVSSSSPGSERRMTRQSSSPTGGSTAGVVSAMMGSPRSGCRNTSPNRNVTSSAGSQRTRLNSTGSIGSDSGIGCGTGMASYSSPTKPSMVNSAGTGVWIMSSDSDSPYTISTRSRGSGDKITTYGSGVSSGRISTTGGGNRTNSSGSGNRISYAGSGNRISYAGSGGRISSAGSGNRISSAGSGNRISSAGSGNRISSAGSGNRISSAGSGNRISSAGSGGRISTAGTGNSRISVGAPMGSSANMMVIRSTGSSGGGSNRERISVCKMAALTKAAAVKEKSLGSMSLLHMKSASLEAGEDEDLNILYQLFHKT